MIILLVKELILGSYLRSQLFPLPGCQHLNCGYLYPPRLELAQQLFSSIVVKFLHLSETLLDLFSQSNGYSTP